MAYDQGLAERVRRLLGSRFDVEDKEMFGGIAFMVGGNMACGVIGDELIVRMEREDAKRLLGAEPGTREFDMTGRPMRNWVMVAPEETADDRDLERWVRRGEEFASSLPPK